MSREFAQLTIGALLFMMLCMSTQTLSGETLHYSTQDNHYASN